MFRARRMVEDSTISTARPCNAAMDFFTSCLVFDQGVGEDLLHVVEEFQRIDQFLHLDRVVARVDGFRGRFHDDFSHFGLEASRFQRFLDGGEIVYRGQHFEAAFVIGDDVFGAGFQRRFHQLVFVRAWREQQLAAVLEHEGDRAFVAHIATVLVEGIAYFGHRAHAVVRHAFDDDGCAAHAVAFVAYFFIVGAIDAAAAAVDRALDVIFRHVGVSRLVHRQAQTRIGSDIGAAHAGRYRDFLDQARPDFAALGIRGSFFMLDVGPFAMSCHVESSLDGCSIVADILAYRHPPKRHGAVIKPTHSVVRVTRFRYTLGTEYHDKSYG